MEILACLVYPGLSLGAPSQARAGKPRGIRPSRCQSCLLDPHGMERREGHALLHAVEPASEGHVAPGGMVRRGLLRPLDPRRCRAAVMARGASAHATRRQALEGQSPFGGANPVRNPRAADDRTIKVQMRFKRPRTNVVGSSSASLAGIG